jgi:hypothetical protein
MKNTVENELKNYLLDCINDGILTNDNIDDWHFHAFNEDYYITYHNRAIEWLKTHNLDAFDAIDIVREYETEHFEEFTTDINPESIVNMLAYIYGEEIIYSYNAETIEELESQIKNDLLNDEISSTVTELYYTEKDFIFYDLTDKKISNYILTNDYHRYKNKFDGFISVESAKNI